MWSAWWKPEFDSDRYLYHYTSFETALKILYYDELKISPISRTNDTTEQKYRINYDFPISDYQEDQGKFEDYLKKWMQFSKILCFSQDRTNKDSSTEKTIKDLFDVSGRGFALPRMWAQYSSNNAGVCLIFEKESLVEKTKHFFPEAICQKVEYYEWDKNYKLSKELFDNLLQKMTHNDRSGYFTFLLKEDKDLCDYLYFSKIKDWEGEKEYRFLVPDNSSNQSSFQIEKVLDNLKGVVVGEWMDDSQIKAIKLMIDDRVPMRQINFTINKCRLNDVTKY